LYNVASCWLYLKEYINDARSHERQHLNNRRRLAAFSSDNSSLIHVLNRRVKMRGSEVKNAGFQRAHPYLPATQILSAH